MYSMTLSLGAAALLAVMHGQAAPAEAARLQPQTEQAWREYVRSTEARREREIAARTASPSVTGARIQIAPMGEGGADGSVDVPSGLIHHWRGRVLVPGVTLDDLLRYVRLPPKQSDVLASKILEDRGDRLRLFMKLTRTELITVTYHTEHLVEFRRHGPGRASSRSVATKIAELAQANTPQEREKPAGEDLGLLWRLQAYWWYEEVPGGVLVECESLSLSRGIPLLLKPFASGMVDRVARESMTRTLETLRRQAAAFATPPVARRAEDRNSP